MKGNTISLKTFNESGNIWLQNTLQLLVVQEYGKGSIRNYMQELTLLFKHYNDLQVEDLRQQHIERYLVFIKENHKVAITTHRILNISDTDITFKYKDYQDGNK